MLHNAEKLKQSKASAQLGMSCGILHEKILVRPIRSLSGEPCHVYTSKKGNQQVRHSTFPVHLQDEVVFPALYLCKKGGNFAWLARGFRQTGESRKINEAVDVAIVPFGKLPVPGKADIIDCRVRKSFPDCAQGGGEEQEVAQLQGPENRY